MRERPQQIGGKDVTADQNRRGNFGPDWRCGDLARHDLDAFGNLIFRKQHLLTHIPHSPAWAKRISRCRAAAGGLERRVENSFAWPGRSVRTSGTKLQW